MIEEYRIYTKDIEVSNLGNVRKGGEPMEQHMGKYYYYVVIGGKTVRVHNMVGECFPEICGEKIMFGHYHHLNHNQLDNRAENIRCISNSEHRKLHQIEDGVSIAVKAYDKNGNFVGRWDSKTQAAESTGADYRHITNIINGNSGRYTAGKLFWFKDESTEEEIRDIIRRVTFKKSAALKERKKRKILTEEEKKTYQKTYYQLNKEKRITYQKEYYQTNKEKIKLYGKEYYHRKKESA